MKVFFEDLREGENNLSFDIPSEEIPFKYKGYRLDGRWHVNANFYKNSHREVRLKGKISGEITLICDRCLEEFKRFVKLDFEYFFIPYREEFTDNYEGNFVEREKDVYYKDPFVEIESIISEQVILGLEDKILCSNSCKGILREDGTSYMCDEECVEENAYDPRLLPLIEIKKKIKK